MGSILQMILYRLWHINDRLCWTGQGLAPVVLCLKLIRSVYTTMYKWPTAWAQKSTINNNITIVNKGVVWITTKDTLSTVQHASVISPSRSGRPWSIFSMSFENLLTIRPVGVVSKKDIGALRIFTRKSLWILLAALIQQCLCTVA